MEKIWSLYILECKDGTLYVGMTNRLEIRLLVHNNGGCKFTSKRLPVRLLWSREVGSKELTHQMEHYMQRWRKSQKMKLVNGNAITIYCFNKYLKELKQNIQE